MQNYYFILGRENKISQMELFCILANFDFGFSTTNISILADDILEIKLNAPAEKIADLINILGGTVKIFQKIALREANIVELLERENLPGKIIFAISNYQKGKIDTFKLALSTKRSYPGSMRIVDGKDGEKLSSAQSFQYEMDRKNVEYGLFDTGIGKLIAVQNIALWSEKDYGKPRSDATSGMLPPKLARMMVNLAVSQVESRESGAPSGKRDTTPLHPTHHTPLLVVDPFCGSGNVLLEAISLGFGIIGSDISEKAVEDTKANIKWLISKFECQNPKQISNQKFQISKQDATRFDFSKIKQDFVVVTEPYLGKPRKSKLRIEEEKEIREESVKLYTDFLLNLKLAASSKKLKAVVIVFPLFELANGKQLSIWENCVDTLHKIGYTTDSQPLIYGRDYQVVKRQIVTLKLTAES